MNKADTLRYIAETGYNVGFGAKKHFASHDIVDKLPGVVGFLSLSIGVFALAVPVLSTAIVSATLIVFGILSIYVSLHEPERAKYDETGVRLTQLFNNLKTCYYKTKDQDDGSDFEPAIEAVRTIEEEFYSTSVSKQILFSDWYAHYKFFWQHQIEWIDEQLDFKLFRDKLPLTFTLTVVIVLAGSAIVSYASWNS